MICLYEKGANPKVPESPDVWLDTNGMIHHVLGDYFLSIDDAGKAGDSYKKALDCYTKRAAYYGSKATKLAWKQFGASVGDILVSAAVVGLTTGKTQRTYTQPRRSAYQSRQTTHKPAVRSTSSGPTGSQGRPTTYTTGYKQSYVSHPRLCLPGRVSHALGRCGIG